MILMVLWMLVKLFVATYWGFLACVTLKRMYGEGELTWFEKVLGAPLLVIFLVLDMLFAMSWGSIIYREKPRWELFTAKTIRHYRAVEYFPSVAHSAKEMRRYKVALVWKGRLNRVDPLHVY